MNAKLMVQYIEFVADRLLRELGCDELYGSANPFDWMDLISMQVAGLAPAWPLSLPRQPPTNDPVCRPQGKTNFFERRNANYTKAGARDGGHHEFSVDAAF